MKTKKPSLHDQRLVSDILTAFMFCRTCDEVSNLINHYMLVFGLESDPFTGCPCSYDDYIKSVKEYEKQIMIEKYGHCDGLED